MPLGYLTLVLHAHLPFVRHPEHDDFLEEDWLYEAITETYIPLLEAFESLDRDRVDWRLTMSISPTLAAMLADPLLQYRYVRHLDNLLALLDRELERNRWRPEFYRLAEVYLARFGRAREIFVTQYDYNLLNGYKRFLDTGRLEIITCGATHGFLPLMAGHLPSMWAQIEQGAREYERHFGRRPRGIWLPECGYVPGVERLLADAGISYFFLDTHGLLYADPPPPHGVYAPIRCPAGPVAALARDPETGRQVWSASVGYPGDPCYREFHRDIGWELDYEYLRPFLHRAGFRSPLGIKYYRVTGKTEDKEPYDLTAAEAKADEHAAHFVYNRSKQVEWLASQITDRSPIVVATYDAELFGHWWYEGPVFLEAVLRKLAAKPTQVRALTVPEYMAAHPQLHVAQPPLCSWGHNGYCEVWLEQSNDWIYPHLHESAERMSELADAYPHPDELYRRALTQAGRELLLAQASDWAFIMRHQTTVPYAIQRTCAHVLNFQALYEQIRSQRINEAQLCELERRHNLFPDLDFRLFATSGPTGERRADI